jgi:hypothetical protein
VISFVKGIYDLNALGEYRSGLLGGLHAHDDLLLPVFLCL